ncbi:metalloprotease [Chryseobacterium sp. S-02]|uniref:metalloprotease n=1 Tax=Chryseobacterium sp. S-02 TaxID=3404064 RepID=UPI003CF326E6
MKTKILFLFLFGWMAIVFGQGCFLNSGATVISGTFLTTGNQNIDYINNREFNTLLSLFPVRPNFLYLHETGSPNAFATTQITNTAFPDGSILLGLNLITSECQSSPSNTCSAIPIILAHEFGHILDFKNSLGLSGKYKELFADFIAGSYLFHRSNTIGYLDYNEVARSFFTKGDYNFNHPDFHGTPEERLAALTSGYNLSQQYYISGQNLTLPILINAAVQRVSQF